MDIESIFSPGGELESALPFYSFRRGQYEMAELVESALETCSHAIIEAGTGTGKSFAYLVPMLLSLANNRSRRFIAATSMQPIISFLPHFIVIVPYPTQILYLNNTLQISSIMFSLKSSYVHLNVMININKRRLFAHPVAIVLPFFFPLDLYIMSLVRNRNLYDVVHWP